MEIKNVLTKRILQICNEQKITPNKLDTLSGLDPGTITSIFYGKSKNPGIKIIKSICDGFDISLFDFFNCDYFKDKYFIED